MAKATSRLSRLVSEASTTASDPVAVKPKLPPIDTDRVRDVSVSVYKARLGKKDAAKMIEEDGEEKLRKRAGIYDPLTVAYFTALGVEIPRVTGVSLFGGNPDN
jgi:hypothetical protein